MGVLLLCTGCAPSSLRQSRTTEALHINPQCFSKIISEKPKGYRPSAWSVSVLRAHDLAGFTARAVEAHPVVTAADVSDRVSRFTADPFMISIGSTWYLFFEVMNCFSEEGDIGYAVSKDGVTWSYQGIALDEKFHLSYPHVFKNGDELLTIPESRQGGGIRLYRAVDNDPGSWRLDRELISGDYADPSIFYHDGKWWIFAVEGGYSLAVFYSSDVRGPWKQHATSPLYKGDKSKSRPAGRVISVENGLVRFAQDNRERYGHRVKAFRILNLTPESFEEREFVPGAFLEPPVSEGNIEELWNGVGMHHIDAHQLEDGSWIAAVDGAGTVLLPD